MVFSMLETLFHAFDSIAKRRRIFKVRGISIRKLIGWMSSLQASLINLFLLADLS